MFFSIGAGCKSVDVGIRLLSEDWKSDYTNAASVAFKTLESKLLSSVSYLEYS